MTFVNFVPILTLIPIFLQKIISFYVTHMVKDKRSIYILNNNQKYEFTERTHDTSQSIYIFT